MTNCEAPEDYGYRRCANPECGRLFEPMTPNQIFCRVRCAKKLHHKKARDARAERRAETVAIRRQA